MTEIHAHEVLRMMEGKSFTKESLTKAVTERFGAEQLFYTCSAKGLAIDKLIEFLDSKGKFKNLDDGFTVDLKMVCDEY